MPSAKFEQDPRWFQRGVENLKEEVAVLEAQLAELEQKTLLSPVLLQKLGEYFGFGAAGKLDWARFKLKLKQEELDRFKAQPEMLKVTAKRHDTAPEARGAPPTDHAGETARQKMERMIKENPAPLEPHIRRVYQSLIEAEQ
ncbi:MAG: hypothetical protein L0312_09025 [Acidobacteria bacterium]|nr:hypothetical protein [Acidobacteriota bacterium]